MKNILVTGGAGYLGSTMVLALLNKGYKVTVLDNFMFKQNSLAHVCSNPNFEIVRGDIRDKEIMQDLMKSADVIIPLAALVGAPLCDKYKKDAISTNLKSIKTLRKIVTSKNKIIFLTSNSGYGIGEKNKFCTEESPLKPISLYGKTKCEAESEILKTKNYVCFRLATVFGQSYRMRSDLLVNNFVFNTVKSKKLTIFEPHFRRNFIHVKDVVNAVIFTIKNFSKLRSNVYNLGLSSANITKIMLAKKIKKQYKKLKITIVKNKSDPDKRDYFVSNQKIEKKGFKAKVQIEEGIRELINIFSNSKEKIINNY